MSKSFGATIEHVLIILVLAIPINLLWKVQISVRQKFGIGSFLCLNGFMVLIEIVRISRVHAFDFQTWHFLWLQLEACVTILMVSATAFRALYVSTSSSTTQHRLRNRCSHRERQWPSSRIHRDEDRLNLTMTRAAPSSVRTSIDEHQSPSRSLVYNRNHDIWD